MNVKGVQYVMQNKTFFGLIPHKKHKIRLLPVNKYFTHTERSYGYSRELIIIYTAI